MPIERHRWLAAIALVVGCLAASSCGVRSVGDCSGGRYDGHGGCIPNSYVPHPIEAAAIRHFQGMTVDRVGCYIERRLRYEHIRIRVWSCWRVADGVLTHDVACIAASGRHPLAKAARAAIPADELRCTT
jgi:hypothetical protein